MHRGGLPCLVLHLGVNIDHVATIRQARYRDEIVREGPGSLAEPDPVLAAHEAEVGGADGITVHLREDRRHIQDRDVELLRRLVRVKLNLEMAATDEMVEIACSVRPDTAMLVPEGREEVTTEGGLDVAGQRERLTDIVARLREAGLIVSVFIDAQLHQVAAAADIGCDVCEVHTGPYARAFAATGGDRRHQELVEELARVERAGAAILDAGMRFNAGHALNYHNVDSIAAMAGVEELHIGHAIVSRAAFVGLREAVRQMKQQMQAARS